MNANDAVRLRFGSDAREAGTHTNLSAVRAEGRCLWVAGDETATLERLVASSPSSATYGDQRTFALADFVDLPGPAGDEADVEGLGRSGPYLWAVGSHSLKRKKVKPDQADAKSIKRLAKVEDEPNRRVIVRIPVVVDDHDGLPTLARDVSVDGERRTAAVLGGGKKSLTDLLADDDHLGPFLSIPSKDNGFDLEGVAVHGERLYLGLRGPVLRGWAVVLEVHPEVSTDEPHVLRLVRIGDDGERYLKHFLDLEGLGVRDLCPDGDDLLVLSGPSMDLDGPVRVHRWHGAAGAEASEVVRGDEISQVLDLPYGAGDDHAEGITLFDDDADGGRRLLVVYDSPASHRLDGDGILADVIRLG